MDASDRTVLSETVGSALAAVADDDPTAVDAVLSELGWLDMLDAETDAAVDIVFDALGRTNGTATVLDDVIARALGFGPGAELAVLLPSFGSWAPPGRNEGARMRAVGMTTARISTADSLLVVGTGAGAEPYVMSVEAAAADVQPARGIDPDARLHVVRVDAATDHGAPISDAMWDAAVALGRRAVAHQIAGAARTMLDLARTHAIERVQFDRPIARFQAVRHRLADALVAIEALDAALAAAGDEPGPETAELAKAIAGRTASTVAAHCQQVLAGMGFTTDHPFHRSLKRTVMLDGLFGSADDLVLAIGHRLLATRHVPTLIEL